MRNPKYKMGDLVEICNTESAFKAHPDMMTGKLGLIARTPVKHSAMFVYYVFVEGNFFSVMEDHLKIPERQQEIKMYDEYTD